MTSPDTSNPLSAAQDIYYQERDSTDNKVNIVGQLAI